MRTFTDETGTRITEDSSIIHQFCDDGISRLIIPVDDLPTENILQHFPRSTKFIRDAFFKDENVLVHCLAGASRSPTIAAAFLMGLYLISPSEAIAKIRDSRPLVCPIRGFIDQLHVYEACQCRPSNQPVCLHWQLRALCETQMEGPHEATLRSGETGLAKIPCHIPYVKTEEPRLVCATCNKILAPKTSLLSDDQDNYYLSQPIDWMSAEFDNREHEGDLACTKCEILVGEYNWNGKRSTNGIWITPAFALHKNVVLEMEWPVS